MANANQPVSRATKVVKMTLKILLISFLGLIGYMIIDALISLSPRSVYCLSDNKCITVMNGKDDEIYFIPGKYTGEEIPSDDYVKVTNLDRDFASVVFTNDNILLIKIDDYSKVFQRSSHGLIKLYNDDKYHNDSLYIDFEGTKSLYKKGVHFINMNLKENYAWNLEGRLK
ncbi:hypothetical protein [Sphingobacterium sp. DR205]|uniref:hypothetical protein n=1 Tax=Sphingobacterium sp. DR205 TaxID=2713573 RepID=UPI0013E4B1D8|nr:hypothetical protein [Sphingobacterium sp. DR205]QIH34401.1 hypothetical protein G6053_16570 [Sphingobacterium sp. DR205]